MTEEYSDEFEVSIKIPEMMSRIIVRLFSKKTTISLMLIEINNPAETPIILPTIPTKNPAKTTERNTSAGDKPKHLRYAISFLRDKLSVTEAEVTLTHATNTISDIIRINSAY